MPTTQPDNRSVEIEARCVRLLAKAETPASLAPVIERRPLSRTEGQVLIEIKAAAVNPSDVKAATGLMAYAVFPRTPGRDYAGVVIDGPAGTVGREVFGSSGDLGIRRDGTHASHLAVEADAVVEKPKGLSWEEAAGIGVPFVTAIEGFHRAGMPKKKRHRAGDGRQRQGRAGRRADRELARCARDRRGAQERGLRRSFEFPRRGD
jgi:NADPH:quinone reductase-like Zn-dependent oxidoreductase